ncbi:MAG: T9SS type A sorting domain-containing protein [Bacteroidetes bacterium]|nr:T9SS type A sorting domain-containing protein [Bacteroidota bacterium]
MKKHFLLLAISFFILSDFRMNGQTLIAVNDTFKIYPGVELTVEPLLNDTFDNFEHKKIIYKYVASQHGKVSLTGSFLFRAYFEASSWVFPDTAIYEYSLIDTLTNDTARANLIFYKAYEPGKYLDLNNVSAIFHAFGRQFIPFQYISMGEFPGFIVPKNSGRSTIFSASPWIGGMDDNNVLHLAAEKYGQGPNAAQAHTKQDFYAGPVMDSYSGVQDTVWNYVWKLSAADIVHHRNNWFKPGYQPIHDIRTWPGNGVDSLGQAHDLAPYVDHNGDSKYNCQDGDYPVIRGDEAIFFILNDERWFHSETEGIPMRIEMHGMAYAFDLPDDSAFKNTIFLHYKLFNRYYKNYHAAYFGLFTDFDIGYAEDDYVGCDVERSLFFGYNGDGFDQDHLNLPEDDTIPGYGAHPPAQGVVFLGGPRLEADGLDNPSKDNQGNQLCDRSVNGIGFDDGIIDNERMGMTGFFLKHPNLPLPGVGWEQNDYFTHYYQQLKQSWNDNTHLQYGGLGHPDAGSYGPSCNFIFPGESDTLNWGLNCNLPNGPKNWTEVTLQTIPGDRRGLGTMGPFNFESGEMEEIDLAFVFARDYEGVDSSHSVNKLRQMVDIIRNAFITNILPDGRQFVSAPEPATRQDQSLKIYPNPANQMFTLVLPETANMACQLQMTDDMGRVVYQKKLNKGTRESQVETTGMNPGVYVLTIHGGEFWQSSKVIIMR